MHIYWTGVAADLLRMGDSSLRWMLRGSGCGEIFAAGHGEAGNDLPVLLSTAQGGAGDGGYRFYGHKMFGTLTPVWTRLGIHAMDSSDPAQPEDRPRLHAAWDTTATRSRRPGTCSACAQPAATTPSWRAPSCRTDTSRGWCRRVAGADLFVVAVFAWALPELRQHLRRRGRAGARPGGCRLCKEDLRGAGRPLDGLPPDAPARRSPR